MICSSCQRELRDDSTYCSGCGVRLTAGRASATTAARLERSRSRRKVAGVCGGLAEFLGVDVTFVRAAWVILSIVPGAVVGGILAYLLAWLVIPDAAPSAVRTPQAAGTPAGTGAPGVEGRFGDVADPEPRQLRRSQSNKRLAGVCGGLAEYFGVDATPIRLLWAILSIVPGAVLGGLAVYALAWVLMPVGAAPRAAPVVA